MAKNDDTVSELEQLRAENAELREQLAEPAAAPTAPKPASFGLSEGTREELARLGHATDPFTGKHLAGEGGEVVEPANCPACRKAIAEAKRSK